MPCCSPTTNRDDVHKAVKASYGGRVSGKPTGCCNELVPSAQTTRAAEKMGYSAEELESVPDDANLGLGCGAPLKTAGVETGMTVLDLGSGAGFDSFLAANVVGPTGRVIGVDMTPEMVQKAKQNALKRAERMKGTPQPQIDFYEGLIEELPLEDGIVDVIISNCVINLSPDKESVFREAYRVLKPGGHVCVSDIVWTKPLPDAIRNSLTAYMGCIAGASLMDHYVGAMKAAGFQDVKVTTKQAFDVLAGDDPIVKGVMDDADEGTDIEQVKRTVVSATLLANKK
jgi:arsenite methyltransferase